MPENPEKHERDMSVAEHHARHELRERVDRLTQDARIVTEKVVKASLLVASDHWDEKAEDPSWGADMHEDMLTDAILEAAGAVSAMKVAKKQYEGKVAEPTPEQEGRRELVRKLRSHANNNIHYPDVLRIAANEIEAIDA